MSSQEYYYVYRLWMPDSSPLRTSADAGPWVPGSWEYIGSRVSPGVRPEDDFGRRYHSSGDFAESFRAQPEAFAWEILSTHATKEEAWDEECRQIDRIWDSPSCANRHNHNMNAFRPRYDEAWQEKAAEANRKKAQDPDWRQKHAEGIRKRTQDPEWRKNNAEAVRKRSQDPEVRRKQSEAGKKRFQDPEERRKVSEGRRRGIAKKRLAKSAVSSSEPSLF